MASNESKFKADFKKDLKFFYDPAIHIWAASDKFIGGVPDLMCTWNTRFITMELKFVSKLPKRDRTPILKHPVTANQEQFLN